MTIGTSRRTAALAAAFVFVVAAAPAGAQAWHYPAFQPPAVATREFNFGIAGSDVYGTTGLAQWREGIGPDTHLGLDVGFASPDHGSTGFLLGGSIGQSVMHATQQTPIDILFTGGLYGMFSGDLSLLRIPFGVSVGHRFPIQGTPMALTPFAHPRLSVDACISDCGDEDKTKLKVDFDLGLDWAITRQLSLRGALTVGGVWVGSSETGFGLSVAFHPQTVRR